MPRVIDTAGALAAGPSAKSGQWDRFMAISATRNWGNLGWAPLNQGHEMVEIDWFSASASGVKFWSHDGDMNIRIPSTNASRTTGRRLVG